MEWVTVVKRSPHVSIAQRLTSQLCQRSKHPMLLTGLLSHLRHSFNNSSNSSGMAIVFAEWDDFTSSTICLATPRSIRMVLAS